MIHLLQKEISQGDLTLGEVFKVLEDSGHWFLVLFFCLPFLQPLPLPGVSIPLGAMIALHAWLSAFHKPPWIPASWKKKDLKGPVLIKILGLLDKAAHPLEKLLHPRGHDTFFLPPLQYVNAVVVTINALLLALPLPIPFSNTVPAIAILVHALGQIQRDILFLILSYFLTGGTVLFFLSLALGVEKGLGLF